MDCEEKGSAGFLKKYLNFVLPEIVKLSISVNCLYQSMPSFFFLSRFGDVSMTFSGIVDGGVKMDKNVNCFILFHPSTESITELLTVQQH